MTKAIAEIPGLGWTASVDPRFADKSLSDVRDVVERRVGNLFDMRIRRISRAFRQEGPARAAIQGLLADIAPDVKQFVQIGAHDGSFDDPFEEYIGKYDWEALLVEPQAEQHRLLAERYADNPLVQTRQVAVSKHAGHLVLFRAVLPEHMEQGTAIASSDRDQVRSEVKRCIGRSAARNLVMESETVPVVTLEELFTTSGVDPNSVDLFATDTEGKDIEIVRHLIGWMGVMPQVIQYEHLHAKPEDKLDILENRLKQKGYKLLSTHKDTAAYL